MIGRGVYVISRGMKNIKWFYSIGDVIKNDRQNFTITEREIRKYKRPKGTCNEYRKWYQYTCNKCNTWNLWSREDQIRHGYGCPICRYEDLTGKRFGRLIVVRRGDNDKTKRPQWWCKCDCGNPKLVLVAATHLRSGHTQSCGCLKEINKKRVNLIGFKCAKLTVEKFLGFQNHRSMWECRCECGNTINLPSSALSQHKNLSCGCVQSKAEYELEKYLHEKNILFETQYKFKDCKFKNALPFDFAIFHPENKKLLFLIELHGEQHYYPFTFCGEPENVKKENLIHRQFLDNIKESYCNQNHIPLLIVRFSNFNVKEKIVDTFYNKSLIENVVIDNYIFTSQKIKNDFQIKKKYVYRRRVIQIDINNRTIKKYGSIAEASRSTGRSTGGISDCCKRKSKTLGGYAWAYDDESFNIDEVIRFATIPDKTRAIPIYQKDLKGNIIKEWNSLMEASKKLGITYQGIWACCNGKQKTSKGFKWEYKNKKYFGVMCA